MDAQQAERLAAWLAVLNPEQREQVVVELRAEPRRDDDDDVDDAWRHLVPQWVSVTTSGEPSRAARSPH